MWRRNRKNKNLYKEDSKLFDAKNGKYCHKNQSGFNYVNQSDIFHYLS